MNSKQRTAEEQLIAQARKLPKEELTVNGLISTLHVGYQQAKRILEALQ